MKTLIFFIALVYSQSLFCQNDAIVRGSTKQRVERRTLNLDNVYEKDTGQKLTPKEVRTIIDGNPKIIFESEINEFGEVDRQLYIPGLEFYSSKLVRQNRVSPGEQFPEFSFLTTNDGRISLSELSDQYVLIRFFMQSDQSFIKKQELLELDAQMASISSQVDIVGILLFSEPESVIKKNVTFDTPNFFRVATGSLNFAKKYGVTDFPTTVLLNPEGIVMKYFYWGDKIDLLSMINQN